MSEAVLSIPPQVDLQLHGHPVVLAVNAGSSSLKFGLYNRHGAAIWSGEFEGLEPGGTPALKRKGEASVPLPAKDDLERFDLALDTLVDAMRRAGVSLQAVSHRIVHGGDRCVAPVRLDTAAMDYLETLNTLAPLHQPHNLAGVKAFARILPQVPQVGCFDTAFHADLPAVETRLPIDRELAAQGLRRYGFHGLSYQYVMRVLLRRSQRAQGRVLLAHLGSGASVCAAIEGRSVATSMGFSALDGLMMGTRSGSIDPGVLLHLWRQGWSEGEVEQLLYKRSGLKGVSGLSADMRTLRASQSPAAHEAIELFTHRLLREAGALLAVLGGVDLIAFTGGIGEHDAALRDTLIGRLTYLGARLNARANHAAVGEEVMAIHAADSPIEVWVIPTDEGRVAAQSAFALLEAEAGIPTIST
jgi:acetate kinase